MRRSIAVAASFLAPLTPLSCGGGPTLGAAFSGEGVEWIDLSYAYDGNTIFWPTARPFEVEVVAAGVTDAGFYYAANNFCMAEHGGTHLDAPVHFAEGRHAADEIPLDRLVGPAVVVDVSDSAAADPDYQVRAEDLTEWEAVHGRIPDRSILLLRTGWGERWPDRERYLGTAREGPEAVPFLHFPGLHPDAARWLVENRTIDAVGIDTPSIDYGQSTLFETHRILYAENIPGFENVANLDRLPMVGAYVVALPMKIAGGSGGPLRIVGVVPAGG
jgi:kynurenine formamidase